MAIPPLFKNRGFLATRFMIKDIIVKQDKIKVIVTCAIILLISGCTSETPQPALIQFNMNGQPVNCIKYENALSCDFKPPSTTTTIPPKQQQVDGCDNTGCFILVNGVKQYIREDGSIQIPASTTTTTLPEGLLDFRIKFRRFIGKE